MRKGFLGKSLHLLAQPGCSADELVHTIVRWQPRAAQSAREMDLFWHRSLLFPGNLHTFAKFAQRQSSHRTLTCDSAQNEEELHKTRAALLTL